MQMVNDESEIPSSLNHHINCLSPANSSILQVWKLIFINFQDIEILVYECNVTNFIGNQGM